MFEFLLEISERVYKRYETIEKNVKSKSNSFYDSVLDAMEELVKTISDKEGLKIDRNLTFILFISQSEFREFILKECKLDQTYFQNIYDISKYINDHKHDLEKEVSLDTVINFLKLLHELSYCYYKNRKVGTYKSTFNALYYSEIYGETEKMIEELKRDRAKLERSLRDEDKQKKLLKEDYDVLVNLTKDKVLKDKNIEEQKEVLQKEVNKLKDIKLSTMEEKVARIVDILERQTSLLEKMEAHLKDGKNRSWGASANSI